MRQVSNFWVNWLVLVTAGVVVYGLLLMGSGVWLQQLFYHLFLAPEAQLTPFEQLGPAAGRYITLLYGVLGAVLVGWMCTLLFTVWGPFRRGEKWAWWQVVVSVGVWFILDTGFSWAAGFPAHALFNVLFLLLFVGPLTAAYPYRRP